MKGTRVAAIVALLWTSPVLPDDHVEVERRGTVGNWELAAIKDKFFDRVTLRVVAPLDGGTNKLTFGCKPRVCSFQLPTLPRSWDRDDMRILVIVDEKPTMEFGRGVFDGLTDELAQLFFAIEDGERIKMRVYRSREDLESNRNGVTAIHSLDGLQTAIEWAWSFAANREAEFDTGQINQ